MMNHYKVVAAVILHEGRYLCMQKGKTKYAYTSYKFEFPGGKIEPGETPQEALKREIREEMELDIEGGEEIVTIHHEYPDFSLSLTAFLCHASTSIFKLNEHASFKWLEKEHLKELDWAQADVSVVECICNEM